MERHGAQPGAVPALEDVELGQGAPGLRLVAPPSAGHPSNGELVVPVDLVVREARDRLVHAGVQHRLPPRDGPGALHQGLQPQQRPTTHHHVVRDTRHAGGWRQPRNGSIRIEVRRVVLGGMEEHDSPPAREGLGTNEHGVGVDHEHVFPSGDRVRAQLEELSEEPARSIDRLALVLDLVVDVGPHDRQHAALVDDPAAQCLGHLGRLERGIGHDPDRPDRMGQVAPQPLDRHPQDIPVSLGRRDEDVQMELRSAVGVPGASPDPQQLGAPRQVEREGLARDPVGQRGGQQARHVTSVARGAALCAGETPETAT